MHRSQFEANAHLLVIRHPLGYDDANWRIKYDSIDEEYFIRWTNGIMDTGHKEWACYLKNGRFFYH